MRSPIPSAAISSSMPVFMICAGYGRRTPAAPTQPDSGSADHDDRRAVAEQPLVGGDADPGAVDLAAEGIASQLPDELAHPGDGLGRHRLPEAGQPAGRVDGGGVAAKGGGAPPDELLGF